MSQGCAFYPSYIITGLDTGTPSKILTSQVLSYDIGPASGPIIGGSTVIQKPADMEVEVSPLSGGIDVYNGISGDNPRGFGVTIELTFTGLVRSSGQVIILFHPINDYGQPVLVIDLNGSVNSLNDYILDTFRDVDAVSLVDHNPDQSPADIGIAGWHGTGAFSSEIVSNKLAIGCCSGSPKLARLYAGLNDNFLVYCDWLRGTSLAGGSGEILNVFGRAVGVGGNTDAGVGYVGFSAQQGVSNPSTEVTLHFFQFDNAGGVLELDLNFVQYPWPLATRKRMLMRFKGDVVTLYMDDEGGGNPDQVYQATLGTPNNDASHRYAGFTFAHTGLNQNATAFGTSELNMIIVPLVEPLFTTEACSTDIPPSITLEINSEPVGFEFVFDSDDITITYISGADWLAFNIVDQTNIELTVDPIGLDVGTYEATFEIASDADNTPQSLLITLVISASGFGVPLPNPEDNAETSFKVRWLNQGVGQFYELWIRPSAGVSALFESGSRQSGNHLQQSTDRYPGDPFSDYYAKLKYNDGVDEGCFSNEALIQTGEVVVPTFIPEESPEPPTFEDEGCLP